MSLEDNDNVWEPLCTGWDEVSLLRSVKHIKIQFAFQFNWKQMLMYPKHFSVSNYYLSISATPHSVISICCVFACVLGVKPCCFLEVLWMGAHLLLLPLCRGMRGTICSVWVARALQVRFVLLYLCQLLTLRYKHVSCHHRSNCYHWATDEAICN